MAINRLVGVGLASAAALLWATTGTAQSFASASLDSVWIGAARLGVAAVFFAVLLALRESRGGDARPGALPWTGLLIAGGAMAVYNLAFFVGLRATSVAIGTVAALGSGPLWAGALQGLRDRQPPSWHWWGGTGIAVGGLAIAVFSSGSIDTDGLGGLALCLLAGLGYAVYALETKRLLDRASAERITALTFIVAAGIAIPIAPWLAGWPQGAADDVPVVLWLGLVATALAYLLFSAGLHRISAATGVALALLEPVAAVGLAVAIVGERPGWVATSGLGVVLVGLAVIVRAELSADDTR